MDKKEYDVYDLRLQVSLMNKIRQKIESYDGLFDDDSDYITHCIIDFHRKN